MAVSVLAGGVFFRCAPKAQYGAVMVWGRFASAEGERPCIPELPRAPGILRGTSKSGPEISVSPRCTSCMMLLH